MSARRDSINPMMIGITLLMSGVILSRGDVVQAEPYLAVRTGLMCSACHVNQTGMGKRNLYGVEFSQTDLPAIPTKSSESGTVLDRNISKFLSIGGDVRLTNFTSLPEVGPTPVRNSFSFFEANLYAEVIVKEDRFTVYIDEQFAPGGAASRELVGILHGLPNGAWIKFGRLNLPYGFRLWDFGYTRSQTNLLGQDIGAEFGIEPGSISFQAAVSNGEPFRVSDSNNGKQLTMRLETVHARGRIGGSLAINSEDPAVPGKRLFVMGGPFIGATGGPLTILGELDIIRAYDTTPGDFVGRVVAYGEANLLLRPGVNAKVAFDYFAPRNGRDAGKRFRIGLEPTITEYLQIRVFYDVNRPRGFFDPLFSPPTNPNQDFLTAEVHLMF